MDLSLSIKIKADIFRKRKEKIRSKKNKEPSKVLTQPLFCYFSVF